MKKLTTVFTISMIILWTNVSGQSTAPAPVNPLKARSTQTYLDIMVNMVSTNLYYGRADNERSDYKKSEKGIQAGFSFQAGITPGFSLVPELYFVRKGGTLKENNPLTGSRSTMRFNTLELPVLARFHMGKFYLNAGPSVSYAFSGKRKEDDKSFRLSFDHSSGSYKRIDAAIQSGGGFEFPLKQKRLALDIRYVYGLTNITRSGEMYNRALMVSVNFSKAWKTNPLGKK